MVNSPTKPLVPGSPMEERVTIMKKAAKIGIFFDTPPKSEISRVCLLSYIIPTIKNSAPVEMP